MVRNKFNLEFRRIAIRYKLYRIIHKLKIKKCQHNTNKCPGHYETNLCGGPNARKCCVEGRAEDCGLEVYENSHIKGYNGLKVEVDEGFVSYMDDMTDIAKGLGFICFKKGLL